MDYEQFYNHWYPIIYKYAFRLTYGNKDASEEIAQETMLAAYKNFASLLQHPNIGGWVYLTAQNITKNYWRKNKKDKLCVDQIESEFPSLEETGYEIAEGIPYEDILEVISSDELKLLLMYHVYGLSATEIAEQKGITAASCNMRLSRLKKKLKVNLGL